MALGVFVLGAFDSFYHNQGNGPSQADLSRRSILFSALFVGYKREENKKEPRARSPNLSLHALFIIK